MPTKRVRVTDHDRRKPHQQETTHVDRYTREQDVNGELPPGARELGPRGDDGPKYPKWNERTQYSLENERECEDCGQVRDIGEMVQMPGGEWYCQPCAQNLPEEEELDIDEEVAQIQAIEKELHPPMEFHRDGEDAHFEEMLLHDLGLEDYSSFDEVPKEILDKIKCPHCGGRQFTLWGDPESYAMVTADLDKAHLEFGDVDTGGDPSKIVCDHCSSELGSLEF